MSGISWILAGGIAGWLTGKLIGKKGYGESLSAGYAKSLDILFGVIGASIGGYLFFWIVVGEAGSFSGYATAVLGSIVLVGFLRQVSARCLPFSLAG
ncbi:MAG: GlsB/YeaQ/YmgE family stress response membrane protein [Candidatus Binatia bacterium]